MIDESISEQLENYEITSEVFATFRKSFDEQAAAIEALAPYLIRDYASIVWDNTIRPPDHPHYGEVIDPDAIAELAVIEQVASAFGIELPDRSECVDP